MLRDNKGKSTYFLGNPVLLCDLLDSSTEQVAAELDRLSRNKGYRAGEMVFRRGDRCDGVYVLRSGEAALLIHAGFGRVLERRAITGEIFGLPEAFDEGAYETSLKTLTDCVFGSIRSGDLSSFLSANRRVCFRMLRLLGSNLHHGQGLVSSLKC